MRRHWRVHAIPTWAQTCMHDVWASPSHHHRTTPRPSYLVALAEPHVALGARLAAARDRHCSLRLRCAVCGCGVWVGMGLVGAMVRWWWGFWNDHQHPATAAAARRITRAAQAPHDAPPADPGHSQVVRSHAWGLHTHPRDSDAGKGPSSFVLRVVRRRLCVADEAEQRGWRLLPLLPRRRRQASGGAAHDGPPCLRVWMEGTD